MAETSKVPVKTEKSSASPLHPPFEGLRREIDRLFDDFDGSGWPRFARRSFFDPGPFTGGGAWVNAPAVDFAETEKGYEVTAELPGIDEKNIEVKYAEFAKGVLKVVLPKSTEAQKAEKKIAIKAA
jgi:HSP20 family protein